MIVPNDLNRDTSQNDVEKDSEIFPIKMIFRIEAFIMGFVVCIAFIAGLLSMIEKLIQK